MARIVFDDGGTTSISTDLGLEVISVENRTTLTLGGNIHFRRNEFTEDLWRGNAAIVDVSGESHFILDGGQVLTAGGISGRVPAVNVETGGIATIRNGFVRGSPTGISGNDAEIEIQDGQIISDAESGGAAVRLVGHSQGRMSGGRLRSSADGATGVDVGGTAEFLLSGGTVELRTAGSTTAGVRASDRAKFRMTGGDILSAGRYGSSNFGIVAQEESMVNIRGGILSVDVDREVTNATLIHAEGTSRTVIDGGVFVVYDRDDGLRPAVGLAATQQARVDVYGGDFRWADSVLGVQIDDEAELTIHGTDFNFPIGQPITSLDGTITGTLLDGRQIDWAFQRAPTAVIRLVPEPHGSLLLGLGGVSLGSASRGRRRRE